MESGTDVQSSSELDIFHSVTGDEESPAYLMQMKEGGKCYKAEEHVQLTRGGRRYSWDIPPEGKGQTAKDHDGFGQQSVGGRKFSWDKPPNLTDFDTGLVDLQHMGGKSYRWDSYRAPSLEEFISL